MQPQRQNQGGFHTGPVNPLPRVVIALFAVVMGIEALFSLGAQGIIGGPQAIGWRLGAIQGYAFSAEIFQWMLANGRWPGEHLARFVTYPFIHGNFTHALFAGVMLLALGKFVGEVFRGWAVLAVFFGASIGGAAVYGLLAASPIPLLGAFPGVYGLIGAFTYLLWLKLGQEGGPQIRAFTLIAFLMGIQLVFGILFGGSRDWIADLSGFVFGFGLSFVVSPGGFARLREKLRHD
ncbi:MAG: rhomboid family intramembrane serine protease [Rhodobacterales bacterium]|nr:rhomboid family intramembrane serine protease [Rhodobacterales bacterium]MDX5390122.1 rhomboid family intramembrane serine protease [Rhodobacterales bacterium]MDX5489813.1 rhomboid family intramembrane serine protease [Rhodobacterales bacterium]